MNAVIKKSRAFGEIFAPTSKSMAHRLLIAAAMAEGTSVIHRVTPSADVLATVNCLKALGAKIETNGSDYTVIGCDMRKSCPTCALNANESGSTLRFLIPIAALCGAEVSFVGAPRLMQRPLEVYENLFAERGMSFEKDIDMLSVIGPIEPGTFSVRGDVSSQFISGLLFALPILESDSIIRILPPLESKSYIELTLIALRQFGINAYFEDGLTIRISGNQKYTSGSFFVEGDYSGAAFPDALNLFGSDVRVLGLDENSAQGDKIYKEIYPKLTVASPEIDISNCPDLAPILFTVAAYFNGATFLGTSRLKIKESDRAEVMATELRKFGADITVLENSVIIKKAELHAPIQMLCGHNDHRVVMSLAVLLTAFGGEIEGAEAVSKSYPDFFEDIKAIGIEVTLRDTVN